MFKKILAVSLLLGAFGQAQAADAPLSFSPKDKVLIISPHPDDEALGAAGAIQRAKASGAAVKVLYLTHGESNEVSSVFYRKKPLVLRSDFIKNGLLRRQEAVESMAFLGLAAQDLVFFGYPDGGTLTIWLKHWGATKAYRSLFTRFSRVPYKDDFSSGNSYKGDDIVRD